MLPSPVHPKPFRISVFCNFPSFYFAISRSALFSFCGNMSFHFAFCFNFVVLFLLLYFFPFAHEFLLQIVCCIANHHHLHIFTPTSSSSSSLPLPLLPLSWCHRRCCYSLVNDSDSGSEVDEYGFKRDCSFDYAAYDGIMSNYYKVLTKRRIKWQALMKNPPNLHNRKSAKLKRYVRKGIPGKKNQIVVFISVAVETYTRCFGSKVFLL